MRSRTDDGGDDAASRRRAARGAGAPGRRPQDAASADVSGLVPDERRRLIAERLRGSGSVSVAALEREFGISAMTARRDLAVLERAGVALRRYGGAVLPPRARHEDSFAARLQANTAAKQRLAAAVLELVGPGQTVFVDSSTTSYFAVQAMLAARLDVTLITNSVPVIEAVASTDAGNVKLVGIGGSYRPLAQSFVGPHASRTVAAHFTDVALLSVKAISRDGQLTDPDALEAEVKAGMLAHADQPLLLIDGSKLQPPAENVVAPLSAVSLVL